MNCVKRGLVLGLLLLGASEARATVWAMNGAGCTPGDPAIQSNRYFVTAGSVNYKGGASGLVTLYCPIAALTQSCINDRYIFRLTYTDSDGKGDAVSVAAQILQVSVLNGTFLGAIPGSQVSSNSLFETTPNQVAGVFTHKFFDFPDLTYYYVRVDMNRAALTSHVATFYGAMLECSIPGPL